MSAQHLKKYICLTREMLCGHCADIYLQGYMFALYPSSVFSSDLQIPTRSGLSGSSHCMCKECAKNVQRMFYCEKYVRQLGNYERPSNQQTGTRDQEVTLPIVFCISTQNLFRDYRLKKNNAFLSAKAY